MKASTTCKGMVPWSRIHPDTFRVFTSDGICMKRQSRLCEIRTPTVVIQHVASETTMACDLNRIRADRCSMSRAARSCTRGAVIVAQSNRTMGGQQLRRQNVYILARRWARHQCLRWAQRFGGLIRRSPGIVQFNTATVPKRQYTVFHRQRPSGMRMNGPNGLAAPGIARNPVAKSSKRWRWPQMHIGLWLPPRKTRRAIRPRCLTRLTFLLTRYIWSKKGLRRPYATPVSHKMQLTPQRELTRCILCTMDIYYT